METITSTLSAKQLRESLADVLNRAKYGSERVLVTNHGKPVAVVVSVEDLEELETLELAADIQALREALAEDDGTRIPLHELRARFKL